MRECVILGNTKLGYSWFVLTHLDGLGKNGWKTNQIDYKTVPLNIIRDVLISTKPEYVFTHLTFHENVNKTPAVLQMYRDVNKKVGTKFVHTMNDARVVDRYMGDIEGAVYMAFVGNTQCIEACKKAWNIPVFFSPYSSLTYDKMATPVNELKFPGKVIFTGSPTAHPDRWEFIKKLQRRLKMEIFQTQSHGDLRHKTPELSVSAECILGLCTGYDIKHYIDVRPFQYMGTGAVFVGRKFLGMDDIIPQMLYYPFDGYTNKDADYVKKIYEKYIVKMDNTITRQEAFKFIQKYHSAKVRMSDVIDVLDDKRDNVRAFQWDW